MHDGHVKYNSFGYCQTLFVPLWSSLIVTGSHIICSAAYNQEGGPYKDDTAYASMFVDCLLQLHDSLMIPQLHHGLQAGFRP